MTENLRPLTVFVHNPKTGGATFRTILRTQFSPATSLNLGKGELDQETVHRLVQERQPGQDVVWGHIKYGLHEHVDEPCRYVFFVRSPGARLASLYLFLLARERPESVDDPADRLIDGLRRYVETGVIAGRVAPEFDREHDNGQTRRLSGVEREGRADRSMLDLALAHVAEPESIVGLTERFDESLVLIQRRWGWRYLHYRRSNSTRLFRHGEAVAEAAAGLAAEHAALDSALYDAAKRRFEADVESEGPGFAGAVATFTERNVQFVRLLHERAAGERASADPVVHANLELRARSQELAAAETARGRLESELASQTRQAERLRSKLERSGERRKA